LKKICKGEEKHYSIAKFCNRAEVLNFKIARAVEKGKISHVLKLNILIKHIRVIDNKYFLYYY